MFKPLTKHRVLHQKLQRKDASDSTGCRSNIFLADAVKEPVHKGSNLNLVLEYKSEDEAREAFEGLSDGGNVLMPFEKVFWGAMFGRLEDQYGGIWQITTEHE